MAILKSTLDNIAGKKTMVYETEWGRKIQGVYY